MDQFRFSFGSYQFALGCFDLFWVILRQFRVILGQFRSPLGLILLVLGHFLYFRAIYYQFHNILRLFDVLTNFPFTTTKTMCDYYLQIWYIRVATRVAQQFKT